MGDVFDGNAYAKDTRKDFMNWSIWAPGAFDYSADKVGLTYGVTAELNQKQWALRGGYFLMGAVSNSNNFDTQVVRARHSMWLELETRYSLFSQPGKLRTIGWVNSAYSGSYRETLNNPALNLDIAQTRTGRIKYGYVFNVEQAITDDIGLFGRWSWNDGKTEIMAFTDIDASLSLGASIKGTTWGRPDDVIGLGGAINALSNDHRDFIAAGGLGVLDRRRPAQLPPGTHPRDLLRLRAHQAAHADRGLPVHHQPRLQRRPRPGPCVLRPLARRVLGLPSSLPSAAQASTCRPRTGTIHRPLSTARRRSVRTMITRYGSLRSQGRHRARLIYPAGGNESARAIAQASRKRGSLVPSINSPGRSDG